MFKFRDIFQAHNLKIWIKPFNIIAINGNGGLVQTVVDSVSIDKIKKVYGEEVDLFHFFLLNFTKDSKQQKTSKRKLLKQVKRARINFIESLAGYSLLCYILQIKDRHNGNILIDPQGHIVHVDFGFMLSNSPGGINFESNFKITR